jgi:hypothetical protein
MVYGAHPARVSTAVAVQHTHASFSPPCCLGKLLVKELPFQASERISQAELAKIAK